VVSERFKLFAKWFGLVGFTLQNGIMCVWVRYLRTLPGDMFFEGTVVLMQESTKFLFSMTLLFKEEGWDLRKYRDTLKKHIWDNKWDTVKVCIPSAIFLLKVRLKMHSNHAFS